MKRKTNSEVAEPPAKVVKIKPTKDIKKKNGAIDGKNKVKTGISLKTKDSQGKNTKPFKKGGVKGGFVGKNKNGAPAGGVSKPPDWVKFKQEKKLVRTARREAGIGSEALEVIARAKVISEKLRRKKGTIEERAKLTDELHEMLNQKGYYKQLALAHDTSRIIQWLLKFASEKIREQASKALMELMVEMIQSKYARNSVKRILKYGSASTRNEVIKSFYGSVIKLASHTLSAPILDYAYTEIASKKQKQELQQEFYGDMYKTNKDDSVESLKDTYKHSPELKNAMLGATKANLLRVLNKNVHDCGLVHAVLYDYLKECNAADRLEMVTTLSPLVAPLSNSKQGVRAAIMCVWHGSNKDKKTILKVLKEHVASLATHEHGHLLILSILSTVDDTVLVNKTLLSILLKDVTNLAKEEWGRKVLLWLVSPEDKAYFHPSLVRWLNTGLSEGNSKKPAEQRAAELLREALPLLCKSIQEETEFWLSNGSLGLATLAIVKKATGDDLAMTLNSISKLICQPSWIIKQDDKEINGIEDPGMHLTLKKIAQNDKLNSEKQEHTFGQSVCAILNNDIVDKWITTNRGCFLLITIYENNNSEVQNSIKKILGSSLKKLKKQSTPGSKILLKKLA